MINKLEVGQKYNIIGAGFWESFNKDLIVLSVSIYSQMATQEVDLFTETFSEYDIDEVTFEKFMKDNPYIYHCREITSRDPLLQKEDGTEYYIFPAMINYQGSSKLLDCVIHSFVTSLSPFKTDDPLYPYKRVTDIDIAASIKDVMKNMIFDGVTTVGSTKDILVPEEEYKGLTIARERTKSRVDASANTEASELANERAYMYNALESNSEESERLSQLNNSLNSQLKNVNEKYNSTISLQATLNAKEISLRAKYTSIKAVVDAYNENAPASEQIILPQWDEI